MFSLICVWTNGWVNSRKAGDLRRYHAHYDVIVMVPVSTMISKSGLYVIFGTENARDKIITRGNNNVILTFWNLKFLRREIIYVRLLKHNLKTQKIK